MAASTSPGSATNLPHMGARTKEITKGGSCLGLHSWQYVVRIHIYVPTPAVGSKRDASSTKTTGNLRVFPILLQERPRRAVKVVGSHAVKSVKSSDRRQAATTCQKCDILRVGASVETLGDRLLGLRRPEDP